jgi:hypothetical protein
MKTFLLATSALFALTAMPLVANEIKDDMPTATAGVDVPQGNSQELPPNTVDIPQGNPQDLPPNTQEGQDKEIIVAGGGGVYRPPFYRPPIYRPPFHHPYYPNYRPYYPHYRPYPYVRPPYYGPRIGRPGIGGPGIVGPGIGGPGPL